MHFTKSVISVAAVFMPLATMAAPSPSPETPLDEIVKRGELSSRELAIRQGNTCAFGGNPLCTSRCFIGGNGGGYCNEQNVCVCNG